MIEVGGLPDVTSAQVARSRTAYKSALSNLENFKKILDVHTARWFVEHPNGKTKSKRAKPKEDPFGYILKSGDLFEWSHGKKAPLLDVEPYRTLLADCARVAKEKRFFHWKLEFPEVFYGPRPGTTQAIQRLEGAGFDAVIGNPPYDVLVSEEIGYDISKELSFYESTSLYAPAIRGARNLYKLFICRGGFANAIGGTLSFIVPMSILGDDQAVDIRKWLLRETNLQRIEAFPQKDDPQQRVFPEAKLSTAIFVTQRACTNSKFRVRTHSGAGTRVLDREIRYCCLWRDAATCLQAVARQRFAAKEGADGRNTLVGKWLGREMPDLKGLANNLFNFKIVKKEFIRHGSGFALAASAQWAVLVVNFDSDII